MRYRHLAIHVPDLRTAEAYYCGLFDLAIMFREARVSDGGDHDWAQLRPGQGWAEAEAAGVEIGMVALGSDDFVLALFPDEPSPGQVFAVGVVTTEEKIAGVRSRLTDNDQVLSSEPGWLDFVDSYQLHWQLASSPEFVGSGDVADRWLDL
jgi:catechol 2,3-dioxygenase-like lactoylglutathione lyase family enzyme